MAEPPVILCIDDHAESLKIRTLLLELYGCKAIAVPDHRSALRAVTEQPVDLLLIDYHLADGQTGEEIARDVRVIRPDVPIVMLTGDSKVPESARLIVDAVLVKGQSSPQILLETIQRLLPGAKIAPQRMGKMPDQKAS
jgi:CheY-like chemotaxis protein